MIGFSIDDFPSTFTTDASWPMPLTLGGGIPFEAYTVDDGTSSVVSGGAASATDLLGIVSAEAEAENKGGAAALAHATHDDDDDDAPQSSADIDLLLSDHERANMSSLFDAIRDFEAPPVADGAPATVAVAPSPVATTVAVAKKPKEKRATTAKRRTHSPPLHPSQPRASVSGKRSAHSKSFSLPKRPVETSNAQPSLPSLRDRLQQLLVDARSAEDERTALLDAERAFLALSPLFLPAKASETAGSLWLILHAARRCEFGCEIAGCHVMRRVVKHCLGCDVALGACKDPCNEAKAMMLHFGSCAKAACVVCHKMRGIDQAHHASTTLSAPPVSPTVAAPLSSFLSLPRSAFPRVPIAPQLNPAPTLSASLSSSSGAVGNRPLASAAAKPVAIQPNPLPTASNPLGLVGASFPHFGYALSLYLEQTSATFRAEVKARVEKRVTAAAGQDLIQHMQKKTRLRSLDDLRADARTLVLGELERELHLHMQAYTWAANNQGSGDAPPQLGGHDCMLPPYLLSVAAAGFATFYAQQATLHAALSGMAGPAPSMPSALSSSSVSRRKPSISNGTAGNASAPSAQSKSRTATRAAQKPDAALAAS